MPKPARNIPFLISNQFLQKRWLIVFLVAIFVIALELEEHQPISMVEDDINFWRELMVFGVLLPLLTGILLTLLVYTEKEKVRAVSYLHRQQALSEQLSSAGDWDTLTERIIQFPATVLPADAVFLLIYNPERDRYDLASEWVQRIGQGADLLPTKSEACRSCKQLARVRVTTPVTFETCSYAAEPPAEVDHDRYCLPLVHTRRIIGLLQIDLPRGTNVSKDQSQLLTSAGHDIARALESALLQNRAIHQAAATAAERRRIARNLHDTLGQNISYLRLKLDQLTGEDALLEISIIKEELERMRAIAEEAYSQVRGTLADLHLDPSADLAVILLETARRVGERASFKVEVSNEGNPQALPAVVKRQIVFILKEALNNIEKHAQAEQVHIQLSWSPDYLEIHIQDDGIGFDARQPLKGSHYGLKIMQERADEIGGDFSVSSIPNTGTQVSLCLPIAAERLEQQKETYSR